jgi:hypothetical protein
MKSTTPFNACKSRLLTLAAAFALAGIRAANAADYPTTILADNPLAYYRLNETSGGTAIDSSASGQFPGSYVFSSDGVYPVLGAPGIDTNSISLSGSTSEAPDFVSIPYNPQLNQPGPFSFEIWIRPTSVPTGGNYRCPIGNSAAYDTATQSGWYVYQTPDVPSELALVTPTGDVFITTTDYTLFKWYYLAGTYDGTNMSFYLNGVLVGTQKASAYVANSVNNAGACVFALGERGDGYGNFDGGLDDAAFYTNALSAAQILNHYTVGTNSFRVAAQPPTILTQPEDDTVYAGQKAQFTVQADGSAPLSYQWYNGSSAVPGATNSSYSFPTTPGEDGESFTVVVTNFVGSVTSAVAGLSVSTGLLIDAPLTSITREAGSAAAFEIVAEGAEPITYQWYDSDSNPIPGATNNVLWLYNVQLTNDSDTYYVAIINPYTSINSDPATLNVQARAVSVATNGYAQVVIADGPVAYWRLDEANGSSDAVDAVGSFDGTYSAGSGSFAYGVTTGIPNDADPALGITGGATIQIPYAIEINPPGPFTVEGWFNASSVTAGGNDYRVPFSSMSNPYGEGPTGWLVYQTAANNWSWWPYNGYYGAVQLTDYDQVVANQWYYLTLVYDGTTFTFYVNGAAKASGTDSSFVQNGNVPAGGAANYNYNYNQGPGLPDGSGNTVLGQRVDDAFNPFSGTIDDVAIYNKALSPQQTQNHFLNTTHLTIANSGTNIVISWSTGTLQSSTNLAGPFVNVTGATSPYTNSISGKQVFFRAQLQ